MTSKTGIRKLLVEAFAIVASILLAFAVDAWWEGAVARSEAHSLLATVGEEFAASREAMIGIAAIHEIEVTVATTLAGQLRANRRAEVSDSIMVLVLNDITFNPGGGAYESLMGSGRLTELRSQTLRDALAAWPAVLEDAVEEQRRLQRLGDEQIKPLLEASSSDLAAVYEMLARWETSLGSAPMSRGSSQVRASPELVNLLERRAYLLRIAAVELRTATKHVEDILSVVEAELR